MVGDSTVTFSRSLIYSATAGAIASYTTNPLDLIKLRLQVQRASNGNVENTGSHYRGFFTACLRSIELKVSTECFAALLLEYCFMLQILQLQWLCMNFVKIIRRFY